MSGHLEQIQIFLAVAQAGGFAKAAATLGTSPSSVTRAVADLEQSLGVQLFKRTTRRVALTQAGQTYEAQMKPLVAELSRIDDKTRAFQTTLQGQLRLSAPLSFGMRFLSEPVAEFREAFPGIAISLNLTDRFVDIMADEYDMALRISAAPNDLSTIWRKIAPIQRSLIASPAYLSRAGTPKTPSELIGHACLSYTNLADGETWQLTNRSSKETHPVRQQFQFACNNGDLLAQMAVREQGIALLPDFLISEYIMQGQLVRILPEWQSPEIWLTAFFPPYNRLPAAIEAFSDTIERAVAKLPLCPETQR